MKIGILYISTGRYDVFWQKFYQSCEKYFLPEDEKTYFVFTDSPNIHANPQILKYQHQKQPWPLDTLLRFEIFLKAEAELKQMDYIFFMNANLEIKSLIQRDFLPNSENEEGLLVVRHPGSIGVAPKDYTYDRNPLSKAYIPMGEGTYYYMGGLNGGTQSAYLSMIRQLAQLTQEDLAQNIVAIWHDESHLNKYMLHRNPKVLEPNYGYPQCWYLIPNPKIIIRDKNFYGGHDYLRGISNHKLGLIPKTLFLVKHYIKKGLRYDHR